MSEKFRRSPRVSQLRARLIEDGVSEQLADDTLQEFKEEFVALSEEEAAQQRPFPLQRLARKLASKLHPEEEDRYAKSYEGWLRVILGGIPIGVSANLLTYPLTYPLKSAASAGYDLLKSAASEGVSAINEALSSGTEVPEATAPLPPKQMSPEGQFHWPIDDPTATMQFIPIPTGILLTRLGPGGPVRVAANGAIKVVELGYGHIHSFLSVPSFLIGVDHANDFLTFYAGFGVRSQIYRRHIRQGVPVGAEREIALIWHQRKLGPLPLYFQMSWRGRYIDPRPHLPSFPGRIGPDVTLPQPVALELIRISRQ